MQQLPHLPQPRPSSGSSPSSRNRSVQRLRAAVTEIRHSWAVDEDEDDDDVSVSPFKGVQGNTSAMSQPRPMVVRLPVRAKHAAGSGSPEQQQHHSSDAASHHHQLSPMPQSPYVFYSGDPTPSAVAAMVRGAKVVRAHGLRDSDDPVTTAQLFGSYSPKKSGSRPPSGGAGGGGGRHRQSAAGSQSGPSSQDEDDDDDDATGRSGSSINTARLERQTEDELVARTNSLMAGDVRPLMEPRSIFFVPSLLSSGPLASQIADEFTAGNVRRKMMGVIQREATNNAAVKALNGAKSAVREHNRILQKEKEENEKHSSHAAALDETVAPGAEGEEGGGGGGHRRKEKDADTIAREQAIEAEASRVRGAVELLRSAKLEGTNRAVLFARIRRLLAVATGGGRNDRFCIHSRRLLQLINDSLDVEVAATHLPQWELLAHKELQAAEAARIARETKSYRRGGGAPAAAASSNSASMSASPSGAQQQQRPPSGGGEGDIAKEGSDVTPALLERAPSSSGLKPDEGDNSVSNASFRMMSSPGFSPVSGAGASAAEPGLRPLSLVFPHVDEFCRNPQAGALLRSLSEEFVATLLDPAQLTVGRVLGETGFDSGRSLAAIAATSPTGDLSSCWQPPLRVEHVSFLADGLLRCLTSTEENRKTTLVELVLVSAFNFARALVNARNDWTAVCNSVEDMYAKCGARAATVAEAREKRRLSPTRAGGGGGQQQQSHGRGRSPPAAGGGNSPGHAVGGNSPSRGGAASAVANNPRSPTSDRGVSLFFADDDDEGCNVPDVPIPTLDKDGVPRHALLTGRPSSMDRDFYEMEYIGFAEFSELQHVMLERRHFAGAPDSDSESQSFGIVRSVCASMSAAFRLVLQEEQLAAAMGGKKKKKISIEDLPPIFPTKSTVLRFKEFRQVFLTQEKVAGPLLPFILATMIETISGGHSRWRVAAPLSAYL